MNPYEYGEPGLLEKLFSNLCLAVFLLGATTLTWFLVKVVLSFLGIKK